MLQRLAVHIALVFLFAFTQMGVATHEISHLADITKHSQQGKNAPAEQCEQCISYAQVANGLQSQPFVLPGFNARFETSSSYYFNSQSTALTAYLARAPPQTSNS